MHEIHSQITGNFLGARAGWQFELANGQVWQQVEDVRRYDYAYCPAVTIRIEQGAAVLYVSGRDQGIRVMPLETRAGE